MTGPSGSLAYGATTITYSVARRERRTLQISVLPDMSVEVVAPKSASDDEIQARVRRRVRWILRQKEFFRQFHPKTPPRRYEGGETHLYLGRRYRLKLVPSRKVGVKLVGGRIQVSCPRTDDRSHVCKLVHDWETQQARIWFEKRLAICVERFKEPHRVAPRSLIIRNLKNRWGSMSRAKRLILNRSLIRAAVQEIDYVIVHELCHNVHYNHSSKFYDLLSLILPDWRARKNRLEARLS